MYKKNNIMTNYDYIMSEVSKLTEHNIMLVLLYDESSYCNLLGKRIKNAYKSWERKLPHKSVFAGQYEYFLDKCGWFKAVEVGRPINISYEVWLSKQYNPEEWDEK